MLAVFLYIKFVIDLLRILLIAIGIHLQRLYRIFVPASPKDLNGEIILVSGGSTGIGRALCHELVRREKNLTIVVWNSNEDRNLKVVKELMEMGVRRAVGYVVDVGDWKQVKLTASRVREEVGDVTMLFNNAGIIDVGNGWEMNPEFVEKMYRVNTLSYIWTMNEFLPSMLEKGKGHVITTSSAFGLSSASSLAVYIATKYSVQGYIESLKEDIRKLYPETAQHIKLTTSYPHYTVTGMTEIATVKSEKYPFLLYKYSPEEVASRIVQRVLTNEEHIYFPKAFALLPAAVALIPGPAFRRGIDFSGYRFGEENPSQK